MKIQILLPFLALATFSSEAFGFSRLVCNDSQGNVIFSGIAELPSPPEGSFQHEQSISYAMIVSDRDATTVDRATLKRYPGIELKGCRGPYAKIFEKDESAGVLRCASGEATELDDFDGSEGEILRAFGLNEMEAKCAAVLPKGKIPGSLRRISSAKKAKATKKK